MHNIWFERALPQKFLPMIEGVAAMLGPASDTPDDPFSAVTEADAIIASTQTYDAAVMGRAPQLKIISRTGIGYDKVDIAAATARGIAVCNAPEGPTVSTAEHAMMLILAVAKNLKQSQRKLRESAPNIYANHSGIELRDLQLGLVGFGRIAWHLAGLATGFGMRVAAFDPFVSSQAAHHTKMLDSLEDLLQSSHVVSLHVPYSESTHHMMGEGQFAIMQSGAIFVNTARGGLVDEVALIDSLQSGHLFGAGLDVTDPEPPPLDHSLLGMENVIITPHIASATAASKDRILEMAISQAIDFLNGERPANLINPEVWKG
jgi:phosphoglycerate dehydrogenase-like enzyme